MVPFSACLNGHRFPSKEEVAALINQHTPVYCEPDKHTLGKVIFSRGGF